MRILHVDDEPDMLEITRRFLMKQDDRFVVECSDSVSNALELLEENKYDLIISDYMMPNIDGLEFLRCVRKKSDIPFIMLTGRGREEVAMKALNIGANRYLQKSSDLKAQYKLLADVIIQEIKHYRAEKDQLKTMKELKESEERFRMAIENLPHGVFIHDLDGNIVMVNEQSCRNTGYSRDELLSMAVADIDSTSIRRDDRAHLWLKLKTGDRRKITSKHRRKNGTEYDAEIHITAIRLNDQPMILAVAQDISKRLETENERKQYISELQMINDTIVEASRLNDVEEICEYIAQAICDTIPNSFVTVTLYDRKIDRIRLRTIAGLEDAESHMEYFFGSSEPIDVSPSDLEHLSKYTLSGKLEYVPNGLSDLIPKSIPKERSDSIMKKLGIENVYTVGFALEGRPYGSVTIYLPAETEIRHSAAIETIVSHFSEMIQHRQAEEAYLESQDRYQALFHSIRDAILVTNKDREIVNCNSAFTDLFGYSLEEIKGKKTKYLYSNEVQYEELGELLSQYSTDSNFFYIVDYSTKSGEVFPGETNVFYYQNQDGDIQGHIGLIRDIRDQLEAERRREFLYSLLRHDMKNKVFVVQTYLDLLKNTELSENQSSIINKALHATSEQNRLIERIQMLYQVDSEALDTVSIIPILREIISEYELHAEEVGICVKFKDSDSEIQVVGGGLLKPLFTNVIANAVIHSKGSHIQIMTKDTGDYILIRVEDDGVGIPTRIIKSILSGDIEDHIGNLSGIGFYLIRKIAEEYGGWIEISSSNLGGTKVDIYLKSGSNQ
ncbi:MAG: putative Histidine kinase [Candidatus Thorarchaeota archaeon]|nr:MAG: putative Histidine kinase [Candidatus Thorarchaeota archaeon]